MVVRSLLRRVGVLALAAAGLAALALPSTAANAAVRGVGSVRHRPRFAGYNPWGGTGYGEPVTISATTTFRVPKLRCGNADQAIAPSIRAYAMVAALFVGCHGGKAQYWPRIEVDGSIKNYPAKPAHAGDKIVLWLNTKSDHVSVADETRAFKVSRTGPRENWFNNSAWIGDWGWTNSHGRLERVPDFGTLTYSNTKVYRESLRRWGWVNGPFNRTSGRTLQIKTGPLSNSGEGFRTYFTHS